MTPFATIQRPPLPHTSARSAPSSGHDSRRRVCYTGTRVPGGITTVPLTITLDKELAQRLRAQAEARKLSVQQWALAILANASQCPDCPEAWTGLNGERLALIRKRYSG